MIKYRINLDLYNQYSLIYSNPLLDKKETSVYINPLEKVKIISELEKEALLLNCAALFNQISNMFLRGFITTENELNKSNVLIRLGEHISELRSEQKFWSLFQSKEYVYDFIYPLLLKVAPRNHSRFHKNYMAKLGAILEFITSKKNA